MTQTSGTRLRMLSRLGCLVLSLLVLAWVLRKVELHRLAETLVHARPDWLLLAATLFGLGLGLAAARWHLVLRLSGCQVHGGATLRTVLVGHLYNTVLFGPAGGDLAKAASYARWFGFPASSILATCVLDRLLGGIGFLIFASCTPGLAVFRGHGWDRLSQVSRSPYAWLALGTACAAAFALHFARRRFRWASPLNRVVRASWTRGLELLRNPRLSVRGVLLAVLSHMAISCVFLCSLKAVTHTSFSMAALFWIFPAISVITSAPVTFAGAGLREGAALFFLGLYGIPGDDAVAASLLVLLVYLLWALIGGVLLWRIEVRAAPGEAPRHAEAISVVIPTLNEAGALPETLARLLENPEVSEIIVSDGGSHDRTVEIAQNYGCRVVSGARGRGAQLRLGAEHAHAEVVLFLHADTWMPLGGGKALLNALRDPGVVGGGFWKVFREKNVLMAGSRLRCLFRLLIFRRIMGDQALFVRRSVLVEIGGVPPVALMEEFELCRKLRAMGRLVLASTTVTTSARRFAKLGIARTYLRMWHVTARYYLGAPAHELQRIYERD